MSIVRQTLEYLKQIIVEIVFGREVEQMDGPHDMTECSRHGRLCRSHLQTGLESAMEIVALTTPSARCSIDILRL